MEFGSTCLEVSKDDELQYSHKLCHEDLSPKKTIIKTRTQEINQRIVCLIHTIVYA